MSSAGAARAAVSVSNARAEASRRNGARSRGPKTPEEGALGAERAEAHPFFSRLPKSALPRSPISAREDHASARRGALFGRGDGFPP